MTVMRVVLTILVVIDTVERFKSMKKHEKSKVSSFENTVIFAEDYDAAIFDVDGVLTKTATIHAKAWKETFDLFLQKKFGPDFTPFDIEKDYALYVDGKLRQDGVSDFLQSRNVQLEEGDSDEAAGLNSIQAIGNHKNKLFLELIEKNGVERYASSVKFIEKLKKHGVKIGVITASRNGRKILSAAGLGDLFQVLINGVGTKRLKLRGKPEPDVFLKAAQYLRIPPSRTLVVEDAIAGVEAASKGNFALVIGVDRGENSRAMKEGGANIVVRDLREVKVRGERKNASRAG